MPCLSSQHGGDLSVRTRQRSFKTTRRQICSPEIMLSSLNKYKSAPFYIQICSLCLTNRPASGLCRVNSLATPVFRSDRYRCPLPYELAQVNKFSLENMSEVRVACFLFADVSIHWMGETQVLDIAVGWLSRVVRYFAKEKGNQMGILARPRRAQSRIARTIQGFCRHSQ